MNTKRTVLAGAAIAVVSSLGVVGMASAATGDSTAGDSLIDKIATKFNLDKTEVQAVFDEERQNHRAEMEAERKQQLADAVTAGKLTQEQADHITSVMAEIEALRGDADPREETDEVRDQIKSKLDELRQWAENNGIDAEYLMGGPGGRGGPGGPGGFGGPRGDAPDSQDDSSSSDSSEN